MAIIGWKDFVNGWTSPYDDHGHGTHVAGIAAGRGNADSRYKGVAPEASVVGLKALDSTGAGSTSAINAALQWVIDNRHAYNIRVANLSLSTRGSSDGADSMSAMVNKAVENGIVVVVSAGNQGPTRYTVGAPSAAAKAITVGAMADVSRNGFALASFSSRGPTADGRIKPDILAPGVSMVGPSHSNATGYRTMSGTSQAAPFAAGVAALMLQANASLAPVQVKELMMETAEDWGPAGVDIESGAGRMDAYRAVERAVQSGGGPAGPGNIELPGHVSFVGQLGESGERVVFPVSVQSSAYPLSVTLITADWVSGGNPNLALEVYNSSGTRLAQTTADLRQESTVIQAPSRGTYELHVVSLAGAGQYYLDLSGGIGAPLPSPPQVRIVAPEAGSTVAGRVLLQADVSAEGGISGVEWAEGGTGWRSLVLNQATGLWEAVWDATAYGDGSYSLTVRAVDGRGQQASASVSVVVANGPPSAWSSGNLETRGWTVTGSGDFSKDYDFAPPAYQPAQAAVTLSIAAYSDAGSQGTDGVPPYLEVWAGSGMIGTIPIGAAGSYTISSTDPGVLSAVSGGSLRLWVRSMDRRNGKQSDRITVDGVVVALTF